MSTIDLEYGIASGTTTTRAEHTTTGRKNLVKAVLGVAGIAAIGAIGTVATVSSRSLTKNGYDDAALARRLDAQITAADPAAKPTASDSLAPPSRHTFAYPTTRLASRRRRRAAPQTGACRRSSRPRASTLRGAS